MSSNAISFQIRHKFSEHYSHCCDILNASDAKMTPKLSLELYSVMYVISDFAAFGYENSRKIVSDALLSKILPTLSMTYPQFTTDMFRKRIMFYSRVVGDMELHAHALMAADVSDAHPVVRCCIAFSDCCLYPPYIENYHAPRPVLSALDVFSFSIDVLDALNTEFSSLYNDICDICSLPTPVQANAPSPPVESTVQVSDNAKKSEFNWYVFAAAALVVIFLFVFALYTPNVDVPAQNTVPATTPALIKLARPKDGQRFLTPSFPCLSPLSIKASNSGDCYFVLADHNTGSAIMSFYVRSGSTIELDVPIGTFDIYYACGKSWYGMDSLFGPDTIYLKCESSFSFTENSGWSVELQPISYGNLDVDSVSPEDFPK